MNLLSPVVLVMSLTLLALSVRETCAQGNPPEYAMFRIDLGTLGTSADAISDLGHVVGARGFGVGYVWYQDEAIMIGRYAPAQHTVDDVNRHGLIVGTGDKASIDEAGIWDDAPFRYIGTLGGDESWAAAVNDFGEICGTSETVLGEDFPRRAFLWRDGFMTDLGVPDGWETSVAADLNDLGETVGRVSVDLSSEAVVWRDGDVEILVRPLGDGAAPEGINNLGEIVGYTIGEYGQAVLWQQDGTPRSIHSFGNNSAARAINDASQVVGFVDLSDLEFRGFVWDATNGMRLLDDLVPPNSGYIVASGRDINNFGQIACRVEGGGRAWGAVASPVTPTMTLSAPAPGLADTLNTLDLTGAIPGADIYIGYGRRGGGEFVGNCDWRMGTAIQIDDPRVFGPFVADASGDVSVSFHVPPAAANLGDILIQAVDPANCQVSQLVVEAFE